MKYIFAALALFAAACVSTRAAVAPPAPLISPQTITLTGTVTRDEWQSYLELPFTVPTGVARLSLNLAYEHKGDGVALDIGLRDPDGQRGWSGSNKSDLTLTAWTATPSYRSGPITPGTWTLVLGVPAVREGQTSAYTATITLEPSLAGAAALQAASFAVLSEQPGWYRGDFHTHTGHSDGFCAIGDQPRAPCPTIASLNAATDAELDFLAVTDHNTLSQLADLARSQSLTRAALIPGTEITTFQGHGNVFGLVEPLEFQLSSDHLPDMDALLDAVEARGALLSINHPALPSGETCMGCGWTASTDWSRIEAMEIVNGSTLSRGGAEGAYSGIPFWENLLNQGYRITGIAGSDNHDATDTSDSPARIGVATTQVYADELSTAAIISGVRSGRVVVDIDHAPGRRMDLSFTQNGDEVFIGGELRLASGQAISGILSVEDLPGSTIEIVASGVEASIDGAEQWIQANLNVPITVTGGGTPGWFRVNVRDAASGAFQLVGNPVYVVPAN